MATSLRVSARNAHGLKNYVQELILFLNVIKIDILLVSESLTTVNAFIKIPHYSIYYAIHSDGTDHFGSANIIKSALKRYELKPFLTNKIEGTILQLSRPMAIAAVYSPPRHSISAEEYDFLSQLDGIIWWPVTGMQKILHGDPV
jgi:hypothetical protein